jgi:protein tyrosine/serine phosphatase
MRLRRHLPLAAAIFASAAFVLLGAAATAEELPGVPNFAVVSPALSRGAQPTREGFRLLRERGIRTIVALRWEHDNEDALAGLRLNSYRLRANQWHPETEDVVRAMKVILTPKYQPVFVHCQAGKDRTGLVVAIYRILIDGWSVEDAIAERKRFGATDFWEDNKAFLGRLARKEARRDLMAAIEAEPVPVLHVP